MFSQRKSSKTQRIKKNPLDEHKAQETIVTKPAQIANGRSKNKTDYEFLSSFPENAQA